jgi:hypothetical protein
MDSDESHAHVPVDAKSLERFQKQMQKAGDLRKLLELFQSNQPKAREEAQRALQKLLPKNERGGLKSDGDLGNLLERALTGQGGPAVKLPPLPAGLDVLLSKFLKPSPPAAANDRLVNDLISEALKNAKQLEALPADGGDPPDPDAPADESAAEEMTLDAKFSESLLRLAERLNDANSPFAQSPAFREALRALRDGAWNTGRAGQSLKDSFLSKQLFRLGRRLHVERYLENLKLPAADPAGRSPASRFRLPRLGLPWGSLPSLGMPRFGGPSAPSADSGNGVLVLLSLVAAGQIGWLLWWRQRQAKARQTRAARGAWPVLPNAVRTREDLIRAFEYLSVLRLGDEVRSWNHRAIAAELGGAEAERRRAADVLAAVYEQARYAPADGPLAEAALAAARRELSLLAGAPIA